MSFEHLAKTQPQISKSLLSQVDDNLLSRSLLFSGPEFSSRATAAISLALHLIDKESEFYTLNVNELIVLSSRDFSLRIKALANSFKRLRNQKSLLMLLQETKLLLLNYHNALIDVLSKADLEVANELSSLLLTTRLDEAVEKSDEFLKKYLPLVNTLIKNKKQQYSIDHIREVKKYLLTESNKERVVIFENVEDQSVNTMNSLLKLLEEPPKSCYLILISHDPNRLLDTIRSRVRRFDFEEINEALAKSFIRDNFFLQESSLESLFYSLSGLDLSKLDEYSKLFFSESFRQKRQIRFEKINELSSFLDEFNAYSLFVKKLNEKLSIELIETKRTKRLLEKRKMLGRLYYEAALYNQNKRVLLDSIERLLRDE